jgi:hypothetical protein
MRPAAAAVALAPLVAAFAAAAAGPGPVPYPAGYRTWAHVKTMQILPGHPLHGAFGGIHHIYANAKALDGYRTGRFPDGAVIVFDLVEANAADHTVSDGARKVVGVMHRDARRYASTGGWGFEGFKGDSRTERAVGAQAAEACFSCHAPQKARDYVFSAWKD